MPENDPQDPPQPPAFNAPKDQAEFDRMVRDRLERERSKFQGFDDFKQKAEKYDELEQSKKDDLQKATERAEAAERRAAQADQRYTRSQAQTALSAAIATRDVPPTAFLGLDLDQFVKDGSVDADAIKSFSDGFPEKTTTTTPPARTTFGQGRRETVEAKPGDRGRAEAERRFGGIKQ